MGVPGFFLWLWKKYKSKKFVFNKNDIGKSNWGNYIPDINNIDELLIDANCLLHPQCFEILNENLNFKDKYKLETKMIENILKYLKFIIDYVDPKKVIYIAIDGVAPVAKIKQQRMRRYKSAKDRYTFENIKKKHKKEITSFWTNSAITPGTELMQRFTDNINKFISETNFGNRKVIFSSANTPSEGEHKLLQYIRNKKKDESSYVIYGLDADLIFLALATERESVFLLRESQQMNNKSEQKDILNYVSIDIMKECVYQEIISGFDKDMLINKPNKKKIINDFIFMCYFLGNDFLPAIPSLDIRCYEKNVVNGLTLLIQAYSKTYNENQDNIINIEIIDDDKKITINKDFMQELMEYLVLFENDFFTKMYKSKRRTRRCNSNDPYDLEMHKLNNLMFKIKNPIELGKDTDELWKFRYYQNYYKSTNNQKKIIKNACDEYYKGMLWVANYYFDKCPSWTWYYPYDHAPFISDLVENFKHYDLDSVKFTKGEALLPFEQLLCVIPQQFSYLLPIKIRYLMYKNESPLIHLFPYDFELDMLYKTQYWQCIPFLPELEIELVKKTISKVRFDNQEMERNKRKDIYIKN
jgi:5'-3' exonuclease